MPMRLEPRLADFSRIRRNLKFYRVASIITGVMLLLLLAEMLLKYTPLHLEFFVGGGNGASLAPVAVSESCEWWSKFAPWTNSCEMTSTGTGANVSFLILVIHGWFYVVYLASCFLVWSPMRWGFGRFLMLALGGIVPFLSFIMESRVYRQVTDYLNRREADAAAAERDPKSEAQLGERVKAATGALPVVGEREKGANQ